MIRKAFLVGLSLFAFAAVAGPSFAGKAKGVAGKVTAVDKEKNSITIETGKKGAKESKTFDTKEVKVTVEDKDGKMDDVKVGMRVQITPSADGKNATAIKAGGAKKKKK